MRLKLNSGKIMTLNLNTHGENIQIWGPTVGADALGNPVNTWGTDKGVVKGIVSKPGINQRDIQLPAGRIAAADRVVILSKDVSIATGDRLEINSINYDTLGESAIWMIKRRGNNNHIQIMLKKVIE